jgi:hypothetical protein
MMLALWLSTVAAANAVGQVTAKRLDGPRGDLVSVDAARSRLTVRAVDGKEHAVAVTGATEYLKVDPSAKTLDGAQKISLADLIAGDRVWARGLETDAAGTLVARQVILMSAREIAALREREVEAWRTHGVHGDLQSIDPATGDLILESYFGRTFVIAVKPNIPVHRLKPGVTSLDGAEAIQLSTLKPGDQLAVRAAREIEFGFGRPVPMRAGEPAGSTPGRPEAPGPGPIRIEAEEILTGTFPRPIRGRVLKVDGAGNTLTLAGRSGELRVTVATGASVRKLVPQQAAAQAGGPPQRGNTLAFVLGDRSELERRTTPITLSEIAVGDFVFCVTDVSAGDGASRVSVVVKLERPPTPRRPTGPSVGGDTGPQAGGDIPNR